MKSYIYLVIVVLISFLISLNTFKIFSIEETSFFLTVIGLMYGIIAAFSISNAWEKFSKIRDDIAEEVSSLESMYIYSKYLADKASSRQIRDKMVAYCKTVPEVEWKDYWKSSATHAKFRSITETVAAMRVKTDKDRELLSAISEELREATRSRNSQLILSQTKISGLQWVLNIFLSLILIAGLAFMSIPNHLLSVFIIGTMISSVLMILFVIYRLDALKILEKEVTEAPYSELVDMIEKDSVK